MYYQHITDAGVACSCHTGPRGEPLHESGIPAACKWHDWQPKPSTTVTVSEPEGCTTCETETDEILETCGECNTTFHDSCGHDCGG